MILLFNTIQEYREYIPVNIASEIDNLKESIRNATNRFLIQVISKEQYNELARKFNNGSLNDIQAELLEHSRRVVANFSASEFLPNNLVQVSNIGIHNVNTKDKKPAPEWQVQKLQRSYEKNGYAAIEELLEFLTENKAKFPKWATSEAFTEAKESLIYSAKIFNKSVFIHQNRLLFVEMKPTLMRMQRTLLFTICPNLFEKILKQLQNGKVQEKYLVVLEMAQTALAKITMAEFIKIKPIQIDQDGITIISQNNVSGKAAAKDNLISMAQNTYEEQGNKELANLEFYLKKNRRNFPEVEEQYPEKTKNAHTHCCTRCTHSVCKCNKRNRKIIHI